MYHVYVLCARGLTFCVRARVSMVMLRYIYGTACAVNHIDDDSATAIARALMGNSTLTTLDLSRAVTCLSRDVRSRACHVLCGHVSVT